MKAQLTAAAAADTVAIGTKTPLASVVPVMDPLDYLR